MREIKFRGKRVDNNEWVYGSLVIDEDRYYICLGINEHIKRDDYKVYMVEVIPKTVVQSTELYDKHGKEIYDGDIIHINDSFFKEFNYLIKWNKEYLRYYLYSIDKEKLNKIGGILEAHLGSMINKIEVIGNIYENSDLLKD